MLNHAAIFHNLPAAIITLDEEGCVTAFNPAAKQLFALSQNTHGKAANSLLPLSKADLNMMLTTPNTLCVSHKERALEFSFARVQESDARGYILLVHDISEHRLALAQSERHHQDALALSQQQAEELALLDRLRTMLKPELGLAAMCQLVVEAVASVYGYNLVSLYLFKQDRLFLQHQVGYHQVIQELSVEQGVMGKVARSGQAILLESPEDDPEVVWAFEGILAEVCVPLYIAGSVIGVLNVESLTRSLQQRDLKLLTALSETLSIALERSKLYSDIRTSELRYRQLVENAGDIIYRTDLMGNFSYVNAMGSAITEYTSEELLGMHYLILIRPDFHKKSMAFYLDQFKNNIPTTYFEFPIITKSGREIWVGQKVQLVVEEERIIGMQAVVRDISERKRAEDALQRRSRALESANADLRQFAFIAAHDLQEPLRKTLAFGNLLHNKYASQLDEKGQLYLERIQTATQHMRHLVDDLLSFTRVVTIVLKPVNLQAILKTLLKDHQAEISKRKAKIDVEKLPTIEADPEHLKTLLDNLLSNALKFARPGVTPHIRVYTRLTEAGQFELHVADNGVGFDEKYLDRIFNVFQRLQSRERFEGTGMGLAICRKIAEAHGGSISASSKPGAGSTFIVSLPVKVLELA